MITVLEYSNEKEDEWNRFNKRSKNGIFLFNRNYMDYHRDRFIDSSLMFYDNDKLIALLPGNKKNGIFYSHDGLTFGGYITDSTMTVKLMIDIVQTTLDYLKINKFDKLIYKCVPSIYYLMPAEEDQYALFFLNGKLIRRDVTSTINLGNRIFFRRDRHRHINTAIKRGLSVIETNDFQTFWKILEDNLERQHSVKPVHTGEEILHLQSKFPENIRLFASYMDGDIQAGVVMYESNQVAHVQYSACNEAGKRTGALDLIFDWLIDYYSPKKKYFDFGISTEKEGKFLNEGLIFFKEGFGARAVVHDFYAVNLRER